MLRDDFLKIDWGIPGVAIGCAGKEKRRETVVELEGYGIGQWLARCSGCVPGYLDSLSSSHFPGGISNSCLGKVEREVNVFPSRYDVFTLGQPV